MAVVHKGSVSMGIVMIPIWLFSTLILPDFNGQSLVLSIQTASENHIRY